MPLTTYVAGEVLTAQSLNDNFTFAATGGLAFINSTAFSAVDSVSLPNNTFSATFENYKIMINLTTLTSAADFTGRLRNSGSDATNAEYQTMFMGIAAGGSANNQTGIAQTSFLLSESFTIVRYAAVLDIFQPHKTENTEVAGSIVFRDKANNQDVVRTGGAMFRLTTSFDSFSFISSVASSITGTIRAYGYANS